MSSLNTSAKIGIDSETAASEGGKWIDVSDFLSDTCKNDLALGEMIHSEAFSLFDIMSAIEMMDPKMDPSCSAARVPSIEERIKHNSFPLTNIPIIDVIRMMDQMLCAEFTWFNGRTLPQTIFTCVYAHKIDMLQDKFLTPFLKATLKTADVIRNSISRVEIRDEEEFTTHHFNLSLCEREHSGKLADELEALENELGKRIAALKTGETAGVTPLQSDSASEPVIAQALFSRIRFKRLFFQAHVFLSEDKTNKAKKALNQAVTEFEIIKKQRAQVVALIPAGTPEPGFDLQLSRRVSSPQPLKPITLLTYEDITKAVPKYLSHLQIVCSIKQKTTLPEMLKFFEEFSAMEPHAIARGFLLLAFFHQNKVFGQHSIQDLIVKQIQDIHALTETHKEMLNNIEKYPSLGEYLQGMSRCYLMLFYALCHNRPRLRRKLHHLIVEWGPIEQKAEEIENRLFKKNIAEKFIFTLFTIDLTAYTMNLYLTLGFELQLYHHTEYLSAYYWLENITGYQLQNIKKFHKAPQDDEFPLAPPKPNKKPKKPVNKVVKKDKPIEGYTTVRLTMLELQNLLSRASSRFIGSLIQLGKYNNAKEIKFGSFKSRYEHRFAPFLMIPQPIPIAFEDYQQNVQFSKFQPHQLLDSSQQHYVGAQKVIEKALQAPPNLFEISAQQRQGLQALLTVCKANTISQNVITAMIDTPGYLEKQKDSPVFDFQYNMVFPVIKSV